MNTIKSVERRRQFFKTLEARSLRDRSLAMHIADRLTKYSSTPTFLFLNVLFFTLWFLINNRLLRGIMPFDSYPFNFLTMTVSLEAIFLSVFVLVSQNREAHIDKIRQEVNLRVNLISEAEITKILEILVDMRRKMGITKNDEELTRMLEVINENAIETTIAQQLERADKPLYEKLKKDFPDLLIGLVKKPIGMVVPSNPQETPIATSEQKTT